MIVVTRINGSVFTLNPDFVERVECIPDTLVTLIDGTRYIISESIPEFIDMVRQSRASQIAKASRLETEPTAPSPSPDEIDHNVAPLALAAL